MPRKFYYHAPLLLGFSLNIVMFIYVYFVVEGGPAATREGFDWLAIFNEVPQTILIVLIGIFSPYFMLWAKFRNKSSRILIAGSVMLATTVISCLLVSIIQIAVYREIMMDVSWVILWAIAVNFILSPQEAQSDE